MQYVRMPGIAEGKLEDRRYQSAISAVCLRQNTLVILPTGLGKTAVALLVSARVLEEGKKVLLLAPTKPLVDQHASYFSEMLTNAKVGMLNGQMRPPKRKEVVESSDFVVSTPQSVSNDLDNRVYTLDGFGMVIFDEAHRATGNYDYVNVAKYLPKGCRSMGMTASPGSDASRIEEVCNNLGLTHIEMRTDDDPDVSPYVHDTYVNRIEVTLPQEILDISAELKKVLNGYFDDLVALKLANPGWPASKKHMLTIQGSLQARLARGEKTFAVFRGLALTSMCIKLLYAIELAETQGVPQLRAFMSKINKDAEGAGASKADRELVKDRGYQHAWHMVDTSRVGHPKISKVMSLVSQVLASGESPRILVFAQYRETCDILAEKLSAVAGARVAKLIGQANGGLKQKEQVEMLDRFRHGDFNVVVSTSVGEEGLDIASTNAVIFYEPVSSEIRTIQRRGRTGRKNDGEVYVLVAKDTVDEAVEKASKRKEDLMRQRLESLSRSLSNQPRVGSGQTYF